MPRISNYVRSNEAFVICNNVCTANFQDLCKLQVIEIIFSKVQSLVQNFLSV